MSKFEIGDKVAVQGRGGKHVVVSITSLPLGNVLFKVQNSEGVIINAASVRLSYWSQSKFEIGDKVAVKGSNAVCRIKHICDGVAMLKTTGTGSFFTAKVSDLQLAPKMIDCASVDLPIRAKCFPSKFDGNILELRFDSKEARDLAAENISKL